MDRVSATARAEHRGGPGVPVISSYVHTMVSEPIGKVLDALDLVQLRPPRPETLEPPSDDGAPLHAATPFSDREGMSSSGETSPRPTSLENECGLSAGSGS